MLILLQGSVIEIRKKNIFGLNLISQVLAQSLILTKSLLILVSSNWYEYERQRGIIHLQIIESKIQGYQLCHLCK
jgi:hypothetical protein